MRARCVGVLLVLLLFVPSGAEALPAGSLDPSFGDGKGFVRLESIAGSVFSFHTATTDPQGRILVSGIYDPPGPASFGLYVARFRPDGTPDPTFGGDGAVTAPGSTVDGPIRSSLAVQKNGRVLVGYEQLPGGTPSWTIEAFSETGDDDPSFGTGGKVSAGDTFRVMALADDDRILLAGASGNDFAVKRLTADGGTDPTFNTDGSTRTKQVAQTGKPAAAFAVAPAPGGKIVAAGTAEVDGGQHMGFARFTAAGVPDTTFDGDGASFVPTNAGSGGSREVSVMPDGRIVYVAFRFPDSVVARLKEDGKPDTTFSTDGKYEVDRPDTWSTFQSGFVQPDGQILVAGKQQPLTGPPGTPALATLVRVGTGGQPDASFGTGGRTTVPGDPSTQTQFSNILPTGDGRVTTVGFTDGNGVFLPGTLVIARVLTEPDNCPLVPNDQADLDGDGLGDTCDEDDDGDGLPDAAEAAIGADPRVVDSDGDGKADGVDGCPTLAGATGDGCPAPPAPAPGQQVIREVPGPVVVRDPLPGPTPDTKAPKLGLTLPKLVKRAAFLKKGVALAVASDEPVRIEAQLVGTLKGTAAHVARAGDIVLAERSLPLGGGNRKIAFKLSKRQRKLIGKTAKLRVVVNAFDAAGNRTVTTKAFRIR